MDGDTSTQVQLSGSTPREIVIDLGTAYDVKAVTFRSGYLDTTGSQKIKLERSEIEDDAHLFIQPLIREN